MPLSYVHRGQKRKVGTLVVVSQALVVESQALVSCPSWAMGTQLPSSGAAAVTFSQWSPSSPQGKCSWL